MPATIASVANEFLARQNLADSTRRCYQSALKPFTQKYGKYLAQELSREELETYLQQLSQQLSYATHNRHQAILSALFAFAVERRYRRDNPLSGIKYLKPRQSKNEHAAESPIHFLRPDQLEPLYQLLKAKSSQPRFYRLQAIACLLHRSGARVSELLGLNLDDLDREGRKFEVLGKGNKKRWCYYSRDAARLLDNYLKDYRPQDSDCPAIFLSRHPKSGKVSRLSYRTLYGDWQELLAGTELENCRIHDLRHTFATERVGLMGIEELRALMGHEDIQTTLRYQKVTSARAETVAQKALSDILEFRV
jgi:integrase/recombinase XerD